MIGICSNLGPLGVIGLHFAAGLWTGLWRR